MKYIKSKLKFLFIIVPVFLCIAVVSILFLPKNNTASQKQNIRENSHRVSDSSLVSQTEEAVKYRLIYAKESRNSAQDQAIPHISDNLINGYLREVVSQFEGQDVFFRVAAVPTSVHEDQADTEEKLNKIIRSRLEYIKEVGAVDIVEVDYSFTASLNAEMINKIGEAGGCYLYLATVPRPDGYDKKIPDFIAYSLENMKKSDTVTAKIKMMCPEGEKTVNEFFSKNKIKDSQLTEKDYRIDAGYVLLTGSFTKEQILALAADENVQRISNVIEDNIEIINVTEGMKTH